MKPTLQGCKHEWKPLGVVTQEQYEWGGEHIFSVGSSQRITDKIVGTVYCGVCGDMKIKELQDNTTI